VNSHPIGKLKKGKIVYGVVVCAAVRRRCDGGDVKFDENAEMESEILGQCPIFLNFS